MQILASALPGFRDLRAPLTAGYLWLVLLWIVVKPDLTRRPTNEIAGTIYDLGKAAGPIWIGLAVGIAAYLVGSVSQILSPALNALIANVWEKLYHHYATRQFNRDGSRGKPLPKVFMTYHRDPVDKYDELASEKLDQNPKRRMGEEAMNPEEEVGYRGMTARSGMAEESKFPATLLLGKEPQLFAEADRLKSESQFRLAIVPSLTAITLFVSCSGSAWWLLGLFPILILLWQSHTRNLEYRYLMFGAIQRGVIESESLEEMKRWIADLEPQQELF